MIKSWWCSSRGWTGFYTYVALLGCGAFAVSHTPNPPREHHACTTVWATQRRSALSECFYSFFMSPLCTEIFTVRLLVQHHVKSCLASMYKPLIKPKTPDCPSAKYHPILYVVCSAAYHDHRTVENMDVISVTSAICFWMWWHLWG